MKVSDYVKKNFLTVAVADGYTLNGKNVRLIGINSSMAKDPKVMEALKATLQEGEILVPGITEKAHAEENILNYANRWGVIVTSVDPSRRVCGDCKVLLFKNNVSTSTPSSNKKSKNRTE
jgi:hypothetical protein